MTHEELESQIRSMIAEERYDEALDLLPALAQAVTEECLTEDQFRQARDFLRAACRCVKNRRAHYLTQLREAEGNRAYSGRVWPVKSVDVTG